MKVELKIYPVNTITVFPHEGGKLAAWQIYFQELEKERFIIRAITPMTNVDWLKQKIREGKIYVPLDVYKAEIT